MIKQDDIIPQVSNYPLEINLDPPQSPKKSGIIGPIIPEQKLQQIKATFNRYYTLLRLIVLLPLSMINRIGNVYFWIHFVISSTERFDTWWKVLSFVGYIFYFTVGSILFFLIAPDLQTQVGQTDRSFGYFGGIFGELKGLVFRNRYSLPQTYLKQQKSNKQRQSIYINLNDNLQRENLKYHIEIKQQSSIYKQRKIIHQKRRIRQLERYNLQSNFKQRLKKQQLLRENLKIYENRCQKLQPFPEQNTQYLNNHFHQIQDSQYSYSRFYQNQQQQWSRQNEQELKEMINHLEKIRKQQQIFLQKQEQDWQKEEKQENQVMENLSNFWQYIMHYQAYFNQPSFNRKRQVQSEKLFKYYLKPLISKKNIKNHQKILQYHMDCELEFLINQIKLITIMSEQKIHSYFYDIILSQTLQYYIFDHELKFLPENEKQRLILHINLTNIHTTHAREKKFYLFLFHLINATDAMIACYDYYYSFPNVGKFQKFELYYYFLTLIFQSIPQIIAQACSLNNIYNNEINITIFAISLVKIIVCTLIQLYKLYETCNAENSETQSQKLIRQHQQRIKSFESYHQKIIKNHLSQINNNNSARKQKSYLSLVLQYPALIMIVSIIISILPVVNRILLYIFLGKIRENDQLLFWVSIICLAYYFIVGNLLAIISFNIPSQQNYNEKRIPYKYFKLFITLIIILLNSINATFLPILVIIYGKCCLQGRLTLTQSAKLFYHKCVYIYLAFEGIPFMLIYLLAISRSNDQEKTFYTILSVLIISCLICSVLWFCIVRSDKDQIMKIIEDLKKVSKINSNTKIQSNSKIND